MLQLGCLGSLAALLGVASFYCPHVLWAASEIPDKPADVARWGDQGDGTFVNPILPEDFSDLDMIRVDDDFYAISSTFQYSPGVVILHSKDLVNWTIIGHAVDDLTRIGPELNWDKMDRYGHGIWAGAIRYHEGKFWIYFGTPDEGFFVTTAANPAGPWEPVHQMWKVKGWDDCCPFWDDDGQGYFVCSNTAGGYAIHLFKLSADGKDLVMNTDRIIHQSRGSEANKLYKINGLYYHYYSEVRPEGRVIMMERSKSLEGPWESKQLNHVNKHVDKEPNQGGLLQLASGQWWFVTHQGTGDWEGRAMVLLPVTWISGWPIIGKPGADGIGNMVWTAAKPIASVIVATQPTEEDFAPSGLGPQWEWNYQPRADKWSLTERPGFLRLYAFPPLEPNDLLKAGNTLTQRVMRTSENEVITQLDISGMEDGQEAGLCHLAKDYAAFGILQAGDMRTLTFSRRGDVMRGPEISGGTIWLRSTWNEQGESQFSFSPDGTKYTSFGPIYQLTWSYYRGDRIGIFCYNNKAERGHIDVGAFHYRHATQTSMGLKIGAHLDSQRAQ
jgi:beta-xylosidase